MEFIDGVGFIAVGWAVWRFKIMTRCPHGKLIGRGRPCGAASAEQQDDGGYSAYIVVHGRRASRTYPADATIDDIEASLLGEFHDLASVKR